MVWQSLSQQQSLHRQLEVGLIEHHAYALQSLSLLFRIYLLQLLQSLKFLE